MEPLNWFANPINLKLKKKKPPRVGNKKRTKALRVGKYNSGVNYSLICSLTP